MVILLLDLKDQEQVVEGNVPLPLSDFMVVRVASSRRLMRRKSGD
jgi:hypothetical protein